MAPRSRSPRRGTPRKASALASAITSTSSESRSPSKSRGGRRGASSLTSSGMSLGGLCCAQSPLLRTIQYFVGVVLVSLAFTWVSLKFQLTSRFICPLFRKIYLEPLGFSSLKPSGLIYLNMAWYAMVTYVVLPFLGRLCIPMCCGVAPNHNDPQGQKRQLGGMCCRMGNAQSNMVEGFVLMVAAVMAAMARGVPESVMVDVTTFYVMVCKIYILAYAGDQAGLRTVSWMSGVMSCLYLFYLAVMNCL